jgi:hypothetical protein
MRTAHLELPQCPVGVGRFHRQMITSDRPPIRRHFKSPCLKGMGDILQALPKDPCSRPTQADVDGTIIIDQQ